MSHTTEKRQHPRIKDRLTLRSSSDIGSSEMATTDLSLGGALVVAGRYFPLMTRVDVTLMLPPEEASDRGPRPVRAQAVVVRVQPPEELAGPRQYELALFFSHMEQRDRNALSRYLSAQPRES